MKVFSIEYVINENGKDYTFEEKCKSINITDEYLEYVKINNDIVRVPFKRDLKDISIIELNYRK